jgi:hypothetical protein
MTTRATFPALLIAATPALACTSTATLRLAASGRSAAGPLEIELRTGERPGSRVVARGTLGDDGRLVVSDVCPGRYFFAFSRAGDASATVTRSFDIQEDEDTVSDVVITGNRVQAGRPVSHTAVARRGEL